MPSHSNIVIFVRIDETQEGQSMEDVKDTIIEHLDGAGVKAEALIYDASAPTIEGINFVHPREPGGCCGQAQQSSPCCQGGGGGCSE